MDFAGKSVIVTGSSDGIGRAAAVEFARRGASVLIHGRNADKLAETVKLCKEVSTVEAKFPIVNGDVTDEQILRDIATKAVSEFGRVDVLINNAGIGTGDKLESGDIKHFDQQIKMHIRAPIFLSQLCFPELKKSKGNILNISSVAAVRPGDGAAFYAIAKSGQNMFTQCAALEFGGQGVRVNGLCPGAVVTDIFKKSQFSFGEEKRFFNDDEVDAQLNTIASMTPLGKNGTVEETAKMIAFLTSSSASMMNGACVVHDGGLSLTGLDTKTLQNAAK